MIFFITSIIKIRKLFAKKIRDNKGYICDMKNIHWDFCRLITFDYKINKMKHITAHIAIETLFLFKQRVFTSSIAASSPCKGDAFFYSSRC